MLSELVKLFEQWSAEALCGSQELTQAGSNRRYFRLMSKNKIAIACYGQNLSENKAFIQLSKHFEKQKLNTPKVLAISDCGTYYLQEDLGSNALFDEIEEGRVKGIFSSKEKSMLLATIAELPRMQFIGAQNLDFSQCYPQSTWSVRSIMWDLNYFKYYFLKPTIEDFNEDQLEADFVRLTTFFSAVENSCFMLRDFQSRNVMWHKNKPYFIDYQAGRKGPPLYDVASFLYQAKANFSDELREELLQHYVKNTVPYISLSLKEVQSKLLSYALLRSLQTLGAYGFRGYFERKSHFLQSVPFALKNLQNLLNTDILEILKTPYLATLLQTICKNKNPQSISNKHCLRVDIKSFSYRVGYPKDTSGNGGGFVFDCRSIPNPGREEQFRFLTGLDAPVAKHLDNSTEMQSFLHHTYALLDTAVERYTARGFKHLMVSFGCTGGQHRSVYSAQNMAKHLREKFSDIEIQITHREQKITHDL
ncbi:MAG: RapZ C-terminal domain-containing protein [Bacteroidales bacterium]